MDCPEARARPLLSSPGRGPNRVKGTPVALMDPPFFLGNRTTERGENVSGPAMTGCVGSVILEETPTQHNQDIDNTANACVIRHCTGVGTVSGRLEMDPAWDDDAGFARGKMTPRLLMSVVESHKRLGGSSFSSYRVGRETDQVTTEAVSSWRILSFVLVTACKHPAYKGWTCLLPAILACVAPAAHWCWSVP